MANPRVPAGVSRIVLGGGIGAGKSQVAEFLSEDGVTVISADVLGHAVLEPGGAAFDAVAGRWPGVVVDGQIDRSLLAAIVFSEPGELAELEAITHPHILEAIGRLAAAAPGLVVLEVPVMLPLRDGWTRVFVDAGEDTRVGRAVARGGDPDDVRRRAASQAERAEWLEWADEVVLNDGTLDALRKRVDELWEKLTQGR